MARKYSGSKGKAGSKKPMDQNPSWVMYKSKEVEMLILKLAKAGLKPSQIGLHLRDNYGIPSVKAITKKRIAQILGEKKVSAKLPEDLSSLIKNAVSIRKHMEKNKKDMTAKRGILLTESKIRKLSSYYMSKGQLPVEWKYDRSTAEMLID